MTTKKKIKTFKDNLEIKKWKDKLIFNSSSDRLDEIMDDEKISPFFKRLLRKEQFEKITDVNGFDSFMRSSVFSQKEKEYVLYNIDILEELSFEGLEKSTARPKLGEVLSESSISTKDYESLEKLIKVKRVGGYEDV